MAVTDGKLATTKNMYVNMAERVVYKHFFSSVISFQFNDDYSIIGVNDSVF